MMSKSENNMCDEEIVEKYLRHLSPLGRKVMTSLMTIKYEKSIKHMKPESNPTLNPSHGNKRSTISIDLDSPKTIASVEVRNIENSCDTFQNYYSSQNNVTHVSSSTNLLKAACTDDIINKNANNTTFSDGGRSNIKKCIEYITQKPTYNLDSSCDKRNEISDNGVSWTDMFDSEILRDLRQIEEDKIKVKKDITKNKKSSPLVKPVLQTEDSVSKLSEKLLMNVDHETMRNKRKHKTTKVDDNVKKIKTTSSKRSNENKYLKKEKNTTSVKNWLNDMNMTNCYEQDSNSVRENNEIDNINKITHIEEQNNSENTIAAKVKRIKKTIQAQLANKGGRMKFKKPVKDSVNLENKDKNSTDDSSKSKAFNPDDKLVKEKKSKAKFVEPIKSELPVKDITYDVIVINDTNCPILENIEADTGTMILMYSNGFCQLNKHYTDVECRPDGVLFCFNKTFYYIKGRVDGIKAFLIRILSRVRLVSFDAKSVLVYLMGEYELEPEIVNIVDTKIGASLMTPDEPPDNFSKVQKLLASSAEYTVATGCSLQKAAWYGGLLLDCSDKLARALTELDLWKVFHIEMRIVPILAGMEYRGISVDMGKLKEMESALLARMTAAQAQCHAAAGRPFQLTSAAQVRAVLYDELRLDTKRNVRIQQTLGRGEKSTSEEMLRSLCGAHPLPALLLAHRRLHKAHATFFAAVAHHVRDGVLHPTWEQSAAATGRIACTNPNLQAIPRNTFSLALAAEDGDPGPALPALPALPAGFRFRSLYVCRPEHVLLAADFRHVECRLLAHAADDRRLRDALAGDDLFAELAAHWLRWPAAALARADRERTKRMVYASAYGAGARRLAALLDLPYDRALAATTSFNRTFPSLKAFGRSVVAECARSGGRVRTSCGRARTLPDIASADPAARAHAERQAVNFVIQGAAADLCKVAMARCVRRLRAARPAAGARLLLAVHDELVWELPARRLHEAAVIIKEAMESSGQECGMPLSLPVAMYQGPSWGDLQPYHPHRE